MSLPPIEETIEKAFETAQDTLAIFQAAGGLEKVAKLAQMLADTLEAGNKAISAGNGGSMCDAMHFAEELTGRFCKNRKALPAIAISDPSHITCTANDFGFDYIFSRYIEAHGNQGDLFLGLSTSGNSENIIQAIQAAKSQGVTTVCLLGKDGGKLKDMADLSIIVPAQTSDRIQEVHIKIIHSIIEAAEILLEEKGFI